MSRSRPILFVSGLCAAALMLGITPTTHAHSLTIGSANVAVADPVVPRPPTTPCVVDLYTDETFAFDNINTACSGVQESITQMCCQQIDLVDVEHTGMRL